MKVINERDVDALQQHLASKYDVDLELYYNPKYSLLRVLKILVPKETQGEGLGTKIMNSITGFADDFGLVCSLTPSTDFGASSLTRLNKFYGRFGFKRNKDYEITDSLIRNPTKPVTTSENKMDDFYKLSKDQAKKLLYKVIDVHTKGVFSDEYWLPIKKIESDLSKYDIEATLKSAEYYHQEGQPAGKKWVFSIPFNDKGGFLLTITASFGPSEIRKPMSKYDIVYQLDWLSSEKR